MVKRRIWWITLLRREEWRGLATNMRDNVAQEGKRSGRATNMGDNVALEGKAEGLGNEYEG